MFTAGLNEYVCAYINVCLSKTIRHRNTNARNPLINVVKHEPLVHKSERPFGSSIWTPLSSQETILACTGRLHLARYAFSSSSQNEMIRYMQLDVFPSMFDKWTELNFKRKSICAFLICYESMTLFCSWQPVLFTWRRKVFTVTTCHKRFPCVWQLQCLLVAAAGSSGYLYRCIIPSSSLQSLYITQREADRGHPQIHPFKVYFESII